MTHKLKRIQMQNEIVFSKKMEKVNFPRVDNKTCKIKIFDSLPSNNSIISEVNRARKEAIVCLKEHNFSFRINDLLCPIQLTNRIENQTVEEDEESSDEGSEEENEVENDGVEENELDDEFLLNKDELNADLHLLSNATGELRLKNYNSTNNSHIPESSPFAAVRCISGKDIVVRKSSIVWLLSKTKSNLSSDRLVRVQETDHGLKKSMFS